MTDILNNFNGYLIKIAGEVLPPQFIAAESYSVTPNQRQDIDSFINGDGELERTLLPHKRSKITFSTVDEITLSEKITLQNIIAAGVIDADERKVEIEYWDDENNTYKTGTFYQPDFDYNIIGYSQNDIRYSPIKITFIEY